MEELKREIQQLERRLSALEAIIIGKEDRVVIAQKFSDVFEEYRKQFPRRATRILEMLKGEG